MVKFIDNNMWVELPLTSVYNLFVAQPGMMHTQLRVDPITLEDGTVITADVAKEGLLTIGVQAFLDKTAQAAGWDNIHTASIRAGYAGPYQVEGTKYAIWMDSVWVYCYQVLAAVKAGTQTVPTLSELIAQLPVLPA